MMILGVDTGGTFTDFVLYRRDGDGARLDTHKVLSTPQAPERAILQGIREMGLAEAVQAGEVRIIHGSTVATNAALEGRGVHTALITNRGFGDLLTLARQTRPRLYELETPPAAPPVPQELCLETGGRIGADGTVLDPLTDADLRELLERIRARKPRAVAINLLFAFLDDAAERRIAEFLRRALGDTVFITRSSHVLPEYREYERGIATWLNASLGPLVSDYLLRLQTGTRPSPLAVMQSSGGTIDAAQAAHRAVNLLLSGPAGGLAAAARLSRQIGEERLMTFDMGGTSTDVALVDGKVRLTSEGRIGPYPVAVPMVDMHTIGAGGGSIAQVDEGGLLQVGPRSAGASPGPACYGQGGTLPTVTDANLVLGRLPADAALAGSFALTPEPAHAAVQALARELALTKEQAAQGIMDLANEHMARALRVISVQRGHDPADFRLCCFGGAGGLHICRLADTLGMRAALVPANAGVLSALGMLLAPVERQLSRTHQSLLKEVDAGQVEDIIEELQRQGREEMSREGVAPQAISRQVSLDLRYQGQSATLNLPWHDAADAEARFHRLHESRYGHALSAPVELVNVRLALQAPPAVAELATLPAGPPGEPIGAMPVHGYARPVPVFAWRELAPDQSLPGPALVSAPTSTTFIEPGWTATVDNYGNLLLNRRNL